ncbi:MAG: 5-formyltetrahydrofolate cyclo-ligase [Candidatus Hydrogenedentes bacterium]|nr:5-formyltetrahydrofolate cyclo-ligase [Candidatus Hydrogenedentota bacterium]
MKLTSTKPELRRELLKQRRSHTKNRIHEMSNAIHERLRSIDLFVSASVLLSYVDHDKEVETLPILSAHLELGLRVAVPYIASDHGLQWSLIGGLDDLSIGKHAILEPRRPCVPFNVPDGAVCLIPAVGWSVNRFRLGYGGGYFDRFLGDFKGVSIGLGFDFQVLPDLPLEAHDQPVRILVTESATY